MSLWKIAWRSIQQRGLASILTALSMALGVMLVVAVLTIHGVVQQSFRTNASLGYNMIVGAKGGKLQLTLNTVYYLSAPVENIPYEYYLEFLPQAVRDAALKNSLRHEAAEMRSELTQTQLLAAMANGPAGMFGLPGLLSCGAMEKASAKQMDVGRDGKLSQFTKLVIPVCLGDYYGNFRVVGTIPELFENLRFGESGEKKYEFSEGRNFERDSKAHSFFEAVVGATVAREKGVKVGDEIAPSHGAADGHTHERKFIVVGILKPTGTPNDRAVFINMEGFYLMEDHAKPIEQVKKTPAGDDSAEGQAARDDAQRQTLMQANHERAELNRAPKVAPLPVEQREVTALLLKTVNAAVAPGMQYLVNKGQVAQGVFPVQEIFSLFEMIVDPIQTLLLVMTAMICVVSGISILVSIYNSMSERKHEIAVMRALGASRRTIMTVILLESIFLALGGGLLGWAGGHVLNVAASSYVENQTGVTLGLLSFAPGPKISELLGREPGPLEPAISIELLLIPALILLAIVVGFLPAMAAYRTDVAKSLGS